MREYVATSEGESLAAQTGLDALANRLHSSDYNRPLFILTGLTHYGLGCRNDEEGTQAEIRATRANLKS